MNNHCVPDFDMDDDYLFPSATSGTFRSRKPSMHEDEVMELLWQNGQVVLQRPNKCKHLQSKLALEPATANAGQTSSSGDKERPAAADTPQLFIQEDEMASWLHYPLDDEPQFDSDLLFPAASCTDTAVIDPIQEIRPQPQPQSSKPPTRRIEDDFRVQGFGHFTRFRPRQDAQHKAVKESASETVVESNVTPVADPPESMASQPAKVSGKTGFVAGSSSVGGGIATTSLDLTVESSSDVSGAEPGFKPSAGSDKKRKDREADDTEFHSPDVVLKDADAKKQVRGSTTKRTRAAEVHNLSERRRRDRINEKMKALQELIPRCNKSDKASMLDDAIEYLKSLQMQVQMMSMGCGMVPMMFPGMQQYMQPIGMGMGMGMGVDVNRQMMPFPMPTPTHLGPRFPVPSYQPIPPFMASDSSRNQVNIPASMVNPAVTQNAYQSQGQTIPDHYQQYLGCQTMPMQQPQVMANQRAPSQAPVVDQKTRVED
ncbi:unnamed protein product [Rhodiola kirilowii]